MKNEKNKISLISSTEVLIFPNTIIPLVIRDKNIIKIIKDAKVKENNVFFLKSNLHEELYLHDLDLRDLLDKVGTVVKILYITEYPNNTIKVFLEGMEKGKITNCFLEEGEEDIKVELEKIEEEFPESDLGEVESILRSILKNIHDFILINNKVGNELIHSISKIKNPSVLGDVLAFYTIEDLDKKQKILEINSCKEKLFQILLNIQEELELSKIKKDVNIKIKNQMDKNQREIYLQEKIRYLKKELGEKNTSEEVVELYREKLSAGKYPEAVVEKVKEELEKLENIQTQSSEFGLIRSYLDTIFALPWTEKSKTKKNILEIQKELDKSHYAMNDIKNRIIEMIGIKIKGGSSKKNVICLYGSPGTGKTSIAESVASALGTSFIKISLGGIEGESEIRGHRRTYIGSMPGKIISAMKKCKIINPVILMDEIDKISSNSRGDPAAALLEVLDPEQNQAFQDHYLDLEYDLSNAIFIATANQLNNMSSALLDRLELIKVPSYLEEEKIKIAQQYILPKMSKEIGLNESDFEINEDILRLIVKYYTREPGVRSLERQINKILRKINLESLQKEADIKNKERKNKVKKVVTSDLNEIEEDVQKKTSKIKKIKLTAGDLQKYLGVKKYTHEVIEKEPMVGIVNGLAYSESGGDVLILESVATPGKGEIKCTGTLGDVMKESVQIAFTFIKSQINHLSLDKEWFKDKDIHLHVPDGATPKDGPSAGLALCLAIYSTISGKKIKNTVAMTGEISLRGRILIIGGLREKLMSAVRGGVKEVIIPKDNEKDLADVPDFVKDKLKIHKLEYFNEALNICVI